jgi:PIN domain nuclease of toxin-antitoxin system
VGSASTVRVLLDTHVWLWWLFGDKRLNKIHSALIEDPRWDLFLSPISVWEACLLIERGRISVDVNAGQWLRLAMQAITVREAPLTFSVAERSRSIRLAHGDPADRFIAATAAEMKIPLMTADANLLRCTDIECVK